MKKILFFLMLLIPFNVFAANEIVIKDVVPVYDENSGIVYTQDSNGDNILFNEKGQSFQYKITIENTLDKDVEVNEVNITVPTYKFMDYSYDQINVGDILTAGSEKEILVNISVLDNEEYIKDLNDSLNLDIVVEEVQEQEEIPIIVNPNTSDTIIMVGILLVISLIMIIVLKKVKVARYVTMVSLLMFLMINVKAEDIISLNFKTNVKFESLNMIGSYINDMSEILDERNFRASIKNFYFNNDMISFDEYYKKVDVSALQNGKVIAYVIVNPENASKYDIYITADGIIYANPNSFGFFAAFENMEHIYNIEGFDTSRVTNMSRMFYLTNKLSNLVLSSFNTSNVTNMSYMFCAHRGSFGELDLSSFDTSKVTNMSYMFSELGSNVNKINLSSFDTSKVINMDGMFRWTGLTEVDLSHFNTSKVTSMQYMFCLSDKLKYLDISDFDFTSVKNISYMFDDLSIYNEKFYLDFSGFDKNLFNGSYKNAFDGFISINKIYVKNEATKEWILGLGYTELDASNVLVGNCKNGICITG